MVTKKSLQKYRPFFHFILRFVATYLVLVVVYKFYLDQFDSKKFEVDHITTNVARVSSRIIRDIGYDSWIKHHPKQSSVFVYIGNKATVRVIEGCNAMSVIVLFVAFILAFSGPFLTTLLFASIGGLFVFVLNIIRIVLIILALYYFPQYEVLLHEIVFPLLIYGIVFFFWIIWINKFSYHAKDLTKASK